MSKYRIDNAEGIILNNIEFDSTGITVPDGLSIMGSTTDAYIALNTGYIELSTSTAYTNPSYLYLGDGDAEISTDNGSD